MPNKLEAKLQESILNLDTVMFEKCLKNIDPLFRDATTFQEGILHFLLDIITADKNQNRSKNRKFYLKMIDLFFARIATENDQTLINKVLEIKDAVSGSSPLNRAISLSDFELAEKFVTKGADVNAVNNDGTRPIHLAAAEEDPRFLRMLLATGKVAADCENTINHGTPAFYAATYGREENLQILMSQGIDIGKDKCPDVLGLIVINNKVGCLKAIIDKGLKLTNLRYFILLNTAILQGHLPALQQLLRLDNDLSADEFTELLFSAASAAKPDSNECLKELLDHGIKISTDKHGNTPLAYASQKTKSRLWKLEFDYVDSAGNTPLHRAMKYQDIVSLQMFLAKNESAKVYKLNAQNKEGKTPLYYSVLAGNNFVTALINFAKKNKLDAAELGLDVACLPSSPENVGALTPLALSVAKNDPECYQTLLEAGASTNCLPPTFTSWLQFAVEHKAYKMIPLFINKEDINKPVDKLGNTVLDVAIFLGDATMVELLLKSPDIEINKANVHDHTPIHRTIINGPLNCLILMLNELERRGQRIDVTILKEHINRPLDEVENNVLDLAVYLGHTGIVASLLQSPHLNLTHVNTDQFTAAHCAIGYGKFDCLCLILDELQRRLNSVNLIDVGQNSLLHYAAYHGQIAIFKELRKRGLIPTQNAKGESPLHLATKNKQKDIIQLFLEDPELKKCVGMVDENGKTAYDLLEDSDTELKAMFSPAKKSAEPAQQMQPASEATNLKQDEATPVTAKKKKKKKTKPPAKENVRTSTQENENTSATSTVSPENNNNQTAQQGLPDLTNFVSMPRSIGIMSPFNPYARKTKTKWRKLLEKYKKIYQHTGDQLVRIPFDEWGIPEKFQFHEHMQLLLGVFNTVLKKRSGSDFKLHDGVYIVGSAALNALLLDREQIEYNDTDIQLVGIDLESVQNELKKYPEIRCERIDSAFGSSLRVNFYRGHEKEPVKSIDITSISSGDFLKKLNGRDVTLSGVVLDVTNGEVVAPWPWLNDFFNQKICTIGPPPESFTDDFVRKIRAIRVEEKLKMHGFSIDKATYDAMIDPSLSFEKSVKRSQDILKATKADVSEKELAEVAFSKARSLRNQIVKLMTSVGIGRTFELLEKYNMFKQISIGEDYAKEMLSQITLPKLFTPDIYNDAVLFDKHFPAILHSIKVSNLSLHDWAYANPKMIVELAENLDKGQNVFKLACCRFLTGLLMAGVDVPHILSHEKNAEHQVEMSATNASR